MIFMICSCPQKSASSFPTARFERSLTARSKGAIKVSLISLEFGRLGSPWDNMVASGRLVLYDVIFVGRIQER